MSKIRKANIYLATLHKGIMRTTGYHMELMVGVTEKGQELESYARKGKEEDWIEENTTANRLAAVGMLRALERMTKEECELHIYTDSQYLAGVFHNGWLKKWITNGFCKANGKPVANADIWKQIAEKMSSHLINITFSDNHKYSIWQKTELKRIKEGR